MTVRGKYEKSILWEYVRKITVTTKFEEIKIVTIEEASSREYIQ